MRFFFASLLGLAVASVALGPSARAAASWVSAQAQPIAPSVGNQPARKAPAAPRDEAAPAWAELNPPQQQALAPLAGTWKTLSEAHKRKWIALSQNYPRMSPDDKALLHSRMTEWAALTPQQRVQARLNFAESKKLPADDKKAMWEAYKALPPEEKRKLAAGAAAVKPPTPATAAAPRPVPPQKLATVPARKSNGPGPRIAVKPGQVDQNTLLPQPGTEPRPSN